MNRKQKKTIFIIFIIGLTYFIFFYEKADYETTTAYYVNGLGVASEQKKTITNWKNYLKHGVETNFYIDGKVFSRENYKNGKRDGDYTLYYENGKLRIANHIHGLLKLYNEDGKLTTESNYREGEIHGLSKIYNENGVLIEQIAYKNGKKNGEYIKWYSVGEYEETLPLLSKEFYINDKLHGEGVRWRRNGNLERVTLYDNGEQLETTWYFESGGVSLYVNARERIEYFEDGKIERKTTVFDEEKGIGKKERWYRNGERWFIENYKDNKLTERKCYHIDGREGNCDLLYFNNPYLGDIIEERLKELGQILGHD